MTRTRPRRKAVYYAHAMCIYGRNAEREELRVIRRGVRGATVVNPARYRNDPEKLADTMGFCLRLVERADLVVFSRLLRKITAGVGKEVNHAFKRGKPVFEIVGRKLVRRTRRVHHITRAATVTLYQKWRYNQGWGR